MSSGWIKFFYRYKMLTSFSSLSAHEFYNVLVMSGQKDSFGHDHQSEGQSAGAAESSSACTRAQAKATASWAQQGHTEEV